MRIAIHLRKVLDELQAFDHGEPRWDGTIQSLADQIGEDRHTISRLCSDDMKNPPLDVLGKCCGWLITHGYPPDRLPHALFGEQPDNLWNLLMNLTHLALYLGEYNRVEAESPAKLWISRRDASVAAQVMEHVLMLDRPTSGNRPRCHMEYVPFHFGVKEAEIDEDQFKADKANALRVFKALQSRPSGHGALMIGSQKVNYITEYFIADLFGMEPFVTPVEECRVPFFLIYREFDRKMSSCCAGTKLPGSKRDPKPGIYYRNADSEWVECPWVKDTHDAGITIVTYDSGKGNIELATLGLSGQGTSTLGTKLVEDGQLFWKMTATTPRVQSRQVAVFISRMHYKDKGSEKSERSLQLKTFKVIEIDERTLRACLRG